MSVPTSVKHTTLTGLSVSLRWTTNFAGVRFGWETLRDCSHSVSPRTSTRLCEINDGVCAPASIRSLTNANYDNVDSKNRIRIRIESRRNEIVKSILVTVLIAKVENLDGDFVRDSANLLARNVDSHYFTHVVIQSSLRKKIYKKFGTRRKIRSFDSSNDRFKNNYVDA